MAKKRILFLYNGGTIGQMPLKVDGQIILAPPKDGTVFKKACDPILRHFEKEMDIDFEIITTKDSSNMTPNDWEKLIFRVQKAQDEEGFDAVGIAHGTDTLAYSASALAFALHGKTPGESGLRIPVCVTGAQNPIYERGGDGRFNLENLFRTLKEGANQGIGDVLVNFWNRVLLGCRTVKVSEKNFDAMHSPAFPDVGEIDARGVHIRRAYVRKRDYAKEKLSLAPKFGRGVVSIELAPGMEPNLISNLVAGGGASAVILKSLGEGSVCCEGDFSLIPSIRKVVGECGVPVFISTKFTGGSATADHYEVSMHAIKAGGIACYDHTDVAVDVKAKWLIGNSICSDIAEFKKAMMTSYAGEVTPI